MLVYLKKLLMPTAMKPIILLSILLVWSILFSCDVPNHPDAQRAREKLKYRKPAIIKPAEFSTLADSLGKYWFVAMQDSSFKDSIANIEGVLLNTYTDSTISKASEIEQQLFEAMKQAPLGGDGQLTEKNDVFFYTNTIQKDSLTTTVSYIIIPKLPTLYTFIVDGREKQRKARKK